MLDFRFEHETGRLSAQTDRGPYIISCWDNVHFEVQAPFPEKFETILICENLYQALDGANDFERDRQAQQEGIPVPRHAIGLISPTERVFVSKGWGWEDWLWNQGYCGKRLFVKEGKKCSWHYHNIKDETFFIESGRLELLHSKEDDIALACLTVLGPGSVFRVPPRMRHRFTGLEDTYFIEVSTEHSDEDVVRLEKGD